MECISPRIPVILIGLLYCCLQLSAQDLKTPGAVTTVSQDGPGLDIRTQNAFARITVYSNNIIRVRLSDAPFQKDQSYAVIASPTPSSLKWQQDAKEIKITTDSLQMVIHKSPFSITFLSPDGKIINEDEKGLTTSWIGTAVTTYKALQPHERFIGLGEKTGPLDRAGNAYTNWNSDVYGYHIDQDPLYSDIPFYIGTHEGISYGIFLDNSYRTDFNFGASNRRFSSFGAQAGEMNYYFIYHTTVAGIIKSYTALTGRMKMPPLWSLGYQQNRYSYYPDTEVLRIAHTLREKKIPADGITLDIHYMDHYKLFTWDPERFPHPRAMTEELKQMGFTTTVIVDPGIKVEKGYPAYEDGITQNIFLKYADGQPYTGQVWPGWCHFPDFTTVKGRDWWKKEIKQYANAGVSGIWNDMNEISTWGQKMPDNVIFGFDGAPTTHLQGHNVFGLEMARSSFEGMQAATGGRPFILSRSGFAGLQRYSAIWTGDNRAEDDHMLAGVRLLTSLGLSGVSFTGMDIGGFTGNPTQALYTRWMQLGSFIPYFRNHTANNSKAAEPWTFGEEVTEICRRYISLRYTLLPYLYSSFRESTLEGMPVARSLAIDYTADPKIYDPHYQNEFMCGDALLIMPQESTASFAKIYLPAGEWYDAYTGEKNTGSQEKIIELSADHLPVFIKGGSFIPRQSLVQFTGQTPSDTLDIHLYAGNQKDSLSYYEDDGQTYNYEKDDYYQRTLRFDPAGHTITFDGPQGKRHSRHGHIRLLLHGFGDIKTINNGTDLLLSNEQMAFLPGDVPETGPASIKTVLITNDEKTMSFRY